MNPRPTHNVLQFHGSLPRVVLLGLLLVAAVLLAGAEPSIRLQQRLNECESPLDQEESSEEAIARVQGTTKLRQRQPPLWITVVAQQTGKHLDAFHVNHTSLVGHRLHDNILVPLRL